MASAKKKDNDSYLIDCAKHEFQSFVDEIRHSDEKLTRERLKALSNKLKEIRKLTANLPTNSLLKNLSIPDKKIAALLGIGKEFSSCEEDYLDILEIIATHKGVDAGFAVVQFIKTDIGFELLNREVSVPLANLLEKKGEDYKKDALPVLESFFGGAFGLNITSEILKSIRAEEICCLVTYAITGNSEKDIIEFKKNNPKANDKDILTFIKEKAFETDITLKLINNGNLKAVEGELSEEEHRHEGQRRASRRLDTCMLSHENQSGFVENIYIANTTSNKITKEQKRSFIFYYLASLKLSKTEVCYGIPNRLFGAMVNPIYFMTGLFPDNVADEKSTKNDKKPIQQIQRNFIKYIKESGLTKKECRDLAQISFISLVGNCNTIDEVVILLAHNPIIAGCDTLDLYKVHLKMNEFIRLGQKDKARALAQETVCSKIHLATLAAHKLIAKNKNNFADISNLDQQSLETNTTMGYVIKNIENSISSLSDVFDFKETPHLKEEIVKAIEEFGDFKGDIQNSNFASTVSSLLKVGNSFKTSEFEQNDFPALETNLWGVIEKEKYDSVHYSKEKIPQTIQDINYEEFVSDFEEILKESSVLQNGAMKVVFNAMKHFGDHITGNDINRESFRNFVEKNLNGFANLKSLHTSITQAKSATDLLKYRKVSKFIDAIQFLFFPSKGLHQSTKKEKSLRDLLLKQYKQISKIKSGIKNNKP